MFSKIIVPTVSKTPAFIASNHMAPEFVLNAISRILRFKLQDLVFFNANIPKEKLHQGHTGVVKCVERYAVMSGDSTLCPIMQCVCVCCLVPEGLNILLESLY
jgi:hypothetical protein